MNVLYISYDGLTDPLGGSQILPYLEGLAKEGHAFHIISCEKKDAYRKKGKALKSRLNKSAIDWIPISYTKSPPILSTLKDILHIRRALKKISRTEEIHAIHCRSYISMFAAFSFSRAKNIPLIFDMRGFWADERLEGGIWNRGNPMFKNLYEWIKKQEKAWFGETEKVISLTERGKEYILEKFDVKAENIQVIPCSADESFFKPSNVPSTFRDEFFARHGIEKSDKMLGYAGSIGTWYMAREMMLQFKRLESENVVQRFLFITREKKSNLLELARELELNEEKIMVISGDREEMPALLSLFDLGIFYIRPTFSKIASSPTKLGEMLCMGIPVLCNSDVGDLNDFFSVHKVGLCHDIQHLERVEIEKVEALLNLDKNEIRQIGIRELGLMSGLRKYSQAYAALNPS